MAPEENAIGGQYRDNWYTVKGISEDVVDSAITTIQEAYGHDCEYMEGLDEGGHYEGLIVIASDTETKANQLKHLRSLIS